MTRTMPLYDAKTAPVEQALLHAHKMEAIGRLAAGIAHDFNNVLQSILGELAIVLEEAQVGSAAHECAGVARRAAARGADLTRHLLAYARQEPPRPRPVPLPELLGEVANLLSRTLGPRLSVIVRIAPATPAAHADPGQFETALLNLALNGAHAMPDGGTLTLSAAPGATGEVLVSVSDTGTGMDAATLSQAFEPFFSTKGSEGTGLGLPMVRRFAEGAGGGILLFSTPGAGTTAELRLPASRDRAAVPGKAPGIATEPAPAPLTGHALLVEDDAAALRVTSAMLARAGMTTTGVAGAEEALAWLARGLPLDLLICDLALPGMNGLELIRACRAARPAVTALLVTGYADRHPGVPMLHKPFGRDALLAAITAART